MTLIMLLSLAALFFLDYNQQNGLITVPVSEKDLVLKYKDKCVAKINIETSFDKLFNLKLLLIDFNTDIIFLDVQAYFNTLGQLLASKTVFDNSIYSTTGIQKINLEAAGKNYIFDGPLISHLDNSNLVIDYPYAQHSQSLIRYVILLKNVKIDKQVSCVEFDKIENLIKEFKDA